MKTWIQIVLVALSAVIAHQVITICVRLSVFAHYYKHHPGPCHHVAGVQPGSEDFHILPNGLTFISSGLRSPDLGPKNVEFWKREGVTGRVYLLDANKVGEVVKDLKITSTPTFSAHTFGPHGISVWEDKETGRHTVFVVNHPYEAGSVDRVEKFLYDPRKQELVHQATFVHPTMIRVNGIQATGENSFYFTNSGYFRHMALTIVENMLALPLTDVVHCQGGACTVMVSGLVTANGIVWSPDRQYLYVAEAMKQHVLVFKRHDNNSLTSIQIYPVYTVPDNLEVDERTGHVFAACHPIGHVVLTYIDDVGNQLAPSQVIQLQTEDGLIKSSMELFYDHGDFLSASSSALVYNGTLLIGTVFHKLAACKVNVPLL